MSLVRTNVANLPNGQTVLVLTFEGLQDLDPVDAGARITTALSTIVMKSLAQHELAAAETDAVLAKILDESKTR